MSKIIGHKPADSTTIILNTYAHECLMRMADQDYLAARICYRHNLIDQFLWSALQAVEKYLKAILLYNRASAKGLSMTYNVLSNESAL